MVLKKHLLALFILLGLSLFAMKTFWGPNYFDGHDSQAHLIRLHQYDLALKDGQILPQWAGGLLAGRGYPVFIFAYPLPYLIAESFHLVGFTLAVSIKLTLVLAYLISGIGMYFLAGFTGAILWMFAPYMFVKIFITASLGVVVSYAFIPWFFLGLYKKNYSLLILALSLWILSHPGTLVIFSPLVFLFCLKYLTKKDIKPLLISLTLAFGLTAWYFLPANLELSFTHFKEFVSTNYINDFVSLKHLLYSTWGTNAPGWGDNPLSQQVGITQWLAVGLALIFCIKKSWPYLASFGLSIFLMLNISKFIWDLPTPLQSIATPWRFLSLAVFSAALAAGVLVKSIKKQKVKYIISSLLIFLALYGNRNHLRINEKRNYDLNFLQSYTGVATGWNEHLPIWVKDTPHEFPLTKLEVLSGDCQFQVGKIKSNLQEFQLNCSQDSVIQLNTAYYPGWLAKLNGQEVFIEPGENGMIKLKVPTGDHLLIAKFSDTPLRWISKLISLFTLLFILLYYFRHRLNHIFKIFLIHMRIKR